MHVDDIVPLLDTEYPDVRDNQRRLGLRAMLAVPMLREGQAIGTIFTWRREPRAFANEQIALLQTFADQAVIAIENVRLFNETKEALHKVEERTAELTESLEYQTSISEVLRVISESPTDVTPVFEAIMNSAMRALRQPTRRGVPLRRTPGASGGRAAGRTGRLKTRGACIRHRPTRTCSVAGSSWPARP